MIPIKNIPYIYGTQDGLFHYGRKVHNITNITIVPGDIIYVKSYLANITLDNPSDISVEEFKMRNIAGFIILNDVESGVYSSYDVDPWGLLCGDDIVRIDIDYLGMKAVGMLAEYNISSDVLIRIPN